MSLGGFTPMLDRATRLAILEVQRYFLSITDAISTAVSEKVEKAGDTMTGDLTAPRVRLTATGDAGLASTTHAFQVGADAAQNVIIDGNEVMARNNGASDTLFLNFDGGTVALGDSGCVRVNDASELFDDNGRFFTRANTAHSVTQVFESANANDTSDGSGLITVTFTEAFTNTPTVVATRSGTTGNDISCQIYSVSTTNFVVRCFSGGSIQASVSGIKFNWIAMGGKSNV